MTSRALSPKFRESSDAVKRVEQRWVRVIHQRAVAAFVLGFALDTFYTDATRHFYMYRTSPRA